MIEFPSDGQEVWPTTAASSAEIMQIDMAIEHVGEVIAKHPALRFPVLLTNKTLDEATGAEESGDRVIFRQITAAGTRGGTVAIGYSVSIKGPAETIQTESGDRNIQKVTEWGVAMGPDGQCVHSKFDERSFVTNTLGFEVMRDSETVEKRYTLPNPEGENAFREQTMTPTVGACQTVLGALVAIGASIPAQPGTPLT